jgi:hypothetical protein
MYEICDVVSRFIPSECVDILFVVYCWLLQLFSDQLCLKYTSGLLESGC